MMRVKDLPRERAEALCAFIGRKAGKVPGKVKTGETAKEFKERIMKLGELRNVEIFATGTHRGRAFTKGDLEKIATNFKELGDKLKSPLVLGHEEKQEILDNSGLPSLGWASGVRVKDKGDGRAVLVADFDEVPEMAREAIQLGRFKRISSELYENFTDETGKEHGLALRRVALLGAAIPEVKTLADVIALGEPDGKVIFAYLDHEMPPPSPKKKKDGEDDEDEEARKKKEMAMSDEINARFKKLEEENAQLLKAVASAELDKHRAGIASFCEALKREGKYLPKWDAMGLPKFMEQLDGGKVIKFSDKKDDAGSSSLCFFKALLQAMPPVVRLEELAKSDPSAIARMKTESGVSGGELDGEIRRYMEEQGKAGIKLSYVEAARTVAKARPELVG